MAPNNGNATIGEYSTISPRMRAKFEVVKVDTFKGEDKETTISEQIEFRAVCADVKYGENGENEDNDFARWTPFGDLKMGITNPDLLGKMKVADKYYLDFTKCD